MRGLWPARTGLLTPHPRKALTPRCPGRRNDAAGCCAARCPWAGAVWCGGVGKGCRAHAPTPGTRGRRSAWLVAVLRRRHPWGSRRRRYRPWGPPRWGPLPLRPSRPRREPTPTTPWHWRAPGPPTPRAGSQPLGVRLSGVRHARGTRSRGTRSPDRAALPRHLRSALLLRQCGAAPARGCSGTCASWRGRQRRRSLARGTTCTWSSTGTPWAPWPPPTTCRSTPWWLSTST